jgi:hypothetical protein
VLAKNPLIFIQIFIVFYRMKLLKQLAIFWLVLTFFSVVSCDQELKEHPISPQVKQQMDARKKVYDPDRSISGTVDFDESIASKVPKQGTLFIIARPKGSLSGPPLAAKKHTLIKFPFSFKIGQENVMLEGNTFEGDITVKARWDLDGMPKASPDDIDGSVTVISGSKNVKIKLDHVIEAKKGLTDKMVSGIIRIDPNLADQIPEGASLFLIARSEGVQRGIPLAVKKLQGVTFPYSFTLGQADVMLPGALFEGPITIFARLDKDGDAAPATGDIDGVVTTSSEDQKVEIILNHLIGS